LVKTEEKLVLVLASPEDTTAFRVFDALRSLGDGETVRLIRGEQLAAAPYWEHRLGEGEAQTRVRLADGTGLDARWIGAVFNRLQAPSLPHFYTASESDRTYAIVETSALWLSWLTSLPCGVVNPPSPGSLSGPDHALPEWLCLASQAGLPARGYTFSTDPRVFREERYEPFRITSMPLGVAASHYERVKTPPFPRHPVCFFEPIDERQESILIAGTRRVGRLKDRFPAELNSLRTLTGCDLLHVSFGRSATSGDWLVTGMTPFPVTNDRKSISAIAHLIMDMARKAA
jgi:hypothetical protein